MPPAVSAKSPTSEAPTVVAAALQCLPPAPAPIHRAHTRVLPMSSDLVRGVLPSPVSTGSSRCPCCIISEGWPSWISVCLHYPFLFSSVAVHAVALPSSVLDTCRHHFPSWEWTATVPLPVSDDTVILLQGSHSFLRSLPDHLLGLSSAVSFNHAYMVGQAMRDGIQLLTALLTMAE